MPPSLSAFSSSTGLYPSHQWLAEHIRGTYVALSLIMLIILIGTIGYVVIEGWGILDAFYMTVITLSTVGYGEVSTLTPRGKIFTAGLIMAGVCIAAASFGIIGRTLIEGELKRYRGFHKMRRKIISLTNHTIVCGFGKLGLIVTRELLSEDQNVVVIESDPERVAELDALNVPYIDGSAYEDEVLIAAGIERAANLLALLRTDADNVYATLCARDLNNKIRIIARTEGEAGESKLRRAGANQVLSPYLVSSSRIVQQLMRPHVSDFLEIAADKKGTQLVLEEIAIPNHSALAGVALEESGLRNKTGAMIAAIMYKDGTMVISPDGQSVIESGSTLIVLGTQKSLDKVTALL